MEKTINDASLSNASRAATDTPELLDAMEKEFEHLRGTISTLLIRDNANSDKDEILDAIREIGERSTIKGGDDEVLNTLKQEFENMRQRMEMSVVRAEPPSEKEDILAALREHFDNLREETRAKDGSESMLSATSELLDAFNEGIDSIREDIKKVVEKPAAFDSSEILDTLKDGLAELRVDIDSLRESEKSKELDAASTGGELTLAKDAGLGSDIETLKALITNLQDKVEAIDSTPRSAEPAEDALNKGHLDEVLVAIQEVQVAMGEIGASRDLHESAARKEDTDAIQELLMGTKTQLDEMVFPAPDQIATSEHIGNLETMIKDAKDTIADLSTRLEAEAPTKSEVGALEGLIKDVWIALDELKGKTKEGEEEEGENSDKLLKSDLQTVEAMIFEVKSQVDELKLPDVETLPTKDEIQELSSLVTDFREKMEANNDMTAQGFEARKTEHAGLAEKIDEAKFVVGELGDELKSKLDGSTEGLTELKQLLEGLALTAENFSTVESIKELTELINREFERARGEEDATKVDKEERDAAAMVKHDETRAAIIVELGAKIDEKIGEVMAKYEEAYTSLHSKFSETEERDMAHTEAITSTKALAEEIKLVIGDMGSSVNDSCERMTVDTKTLFEKVDESYNRMEEMQNEVRSQQEQSREGNERAVAATERVESKLLEFNPQILETVQQILTVVSQHYDHSQKSTEEFRSELSSLPSNIPSMLPALPPPESSRDLEDDPVHNKLNDILEHAKNSQVHEVLNTLLEHSKNDQLHDKLDRALDQGSAPNGQIYEKLDQLLEHASNGDGSVHEKLDALLSRPANAMDPEHSVTQMMKLDEMHKDIMENTRKMNEMFAAQSALVAEDTERKRREAEEAAIALERRIGQREQVEAELVGLHEEKDSLLKMLQALKTEKEDLLRQNQKLSKDLSGLETALEIRHEEMQQMEDRADGLEKRILEGVLDHARTVLLSRSGSLQSMNLKRNHSTRSSRTGARSPSAMSNATASTAKDNKDPRSILGNGVGMALKRRMPNNLQAGTTAVQPNIGKERRILSLSHVTGNRGADRQVSANSGIMNLKRSHSVKSNFSLRKSSWAGHSSVANKENEAFREEDEHDSEPETDAGTERRTSYAPSDRQSSYAGTERKSSYAGTITDSVVTGPPESVVSEDRRTSGMSTSTRHVDDAAESSIAGDSQVDETDAESESDDAHTAREDDDSAEEGEDDPDHEYRKSIVKDEHEVQDDIDQEISATTSAMEAEVLKLLGPPADSGVGSEMAV
jgi:DNA repair exonuclease SbcCD ATPase subunit